MCDLPLSVCAVAAAAVAAVGNRVRMAGVLAAVSDPPSSPPYFLQCPGQFPVGLQTWEGESLAQQEEVTGLRIVGESIFTVSECGCPVPAPTEMHPQPKPVWLSG